jgi:hypothetical protein
MEQLETTIDESGANGVTGSFTLSRAADPIGARPIEPKTFSTWQDVRAAANAMRKQIHGRMRPISVDANGKIHLQETAMVPERPYEVRLGDDTFQFVRRLDGVVVMYEVM